VWGLILVGIGMIVVGAWTFKDGDPLISQARVNHERQPERKGLAREYRLLHPFRRVRPVIYVLGGILLVGLGIAEFFE
jgi:hypothetical protein